MNKTERKAVVVIFEILAVVIIIGLIILGTNVLKNRWQSIRVLRQRLSCIHQRVLVLPDNLAPQSLPQVFFGLYLLVLYSLPQIGHTLVTSSIPESRLNFE